MAKMLSTGLPLQSAPVRLMLPSAFQPLGAGCGGPGRRLLRPRAAPFPGRGRIRPAGRGWDGNLSSVDFGKSEGAPPRLPFQPRGSNFGSYNERGGARGGAAGQVTHLVPAGPASLSSGSRAAGPLHLPLHVVSALPPCSRRTPTRAPWHPASSVSPSRVLGDGRSAARAPMRPLPAVAGAGGPAALQAWRPRPAAGRCLGSE